MRQTLVYLALLLALALPAAATPPEGLSTWCGTIWNQMVAIVDAIIVVDEADDSELEGEEEPASDSSEMGGGLLPDG